MKEVLMALARLAKTGFKGDVEFTADKIIVYTPHSYDNVTLRQLFRQTKWHVELTANMLTLTYTVPKEEDNNGTIPGFTDISDKDSE